MVKGKDQTFARDYNMKAIMQQLFKKEMSCSELAEKIGLSKPAMTKITSEMFRLNLIAPGEKDEKSYSSLGRKRVNLSINPDFGVVAAIDFSTVIIKLWICNMQGKVIITREIPDSEFLTPEILEEVCDNLNEMLAQQIICNKELFSLCIAASGMVDKVSGEVVVSPKFKGCAGIDLRNFFTKKFNCKVEVENDVNLALIGEKLFCSKNKLQNAIMVYVDSGIGGALLVDGKIVDGARGFAGELGLIQIKLPTGYVALDSLCSINAMKDAAKKRLSADSLPLKFSFADFVKLYHQKNESVVSIVNESAEILACAIRNLCVCLDSYNIIVSGRVRLLGSSYLESIRSAMPNCKIEFNKMEGDGIISGAIVQALLMAMDVVIERR